MTKRSGWMSFCAAAFLGLASSVASAQTFSLQDNAYLVNDIDEGTVVEIKSVAGANWPNPQYGGAWIFQPAANSLTFNTLTSVGVDYKVISFIGGGSPRIVIGVKYMAQNKYLSIYLGDAPSWTGGPTGWTSIANILTAPDNRFDTSQFPGGSFYDTYANAAAIIGNSQVFTVHIPVDAGWTGTTQTVRFDNFSINGVTADAKFVVETRDQDLIDDLNGAVQNANALTVALPNSNAYVTLGKTANTQAVAAHAAAAGVGYFTAADFPAALVKYKQYRYQQVTYNGRAAQYLALAGAPANGAPKTAHLAAKTYGNVDFNAP